MDRYKESVNRKEFFCYLNSGCWIGEREFVIKIYKECLDYYEKFGYGSDQSILHKMYYKYYPEIKIKKHIC